MSVAVGSPLLYFLISSDNEPIVGDQESAFIQETEELLYALSDDGKMVTKPMLQGREYNQTVSQPSIYPSENLPTQNSYDCLLYTSDAADDQ